MKHLHRIDEFLSSPYNWDWTKCTGNEWVAEFKTEDDKFWVEFNKEGAFEPYDLVFSSERKNFHGSDMKGPSSAMRILTTVFLDIMPAFLESNPGETVKFYGAQGAHDETVKNSPYMFTPKPDFRGETKRDRVYKMLMRQLPDNLKWESHGRVITVEYRRSPLRESLDENCMYHASNVINRSSIQKFGLDHTRGISPWENPSDPEEYPKGNYFWSTEKEAVKYAIGLGDSFDIWKTCIDKKDLLRDPVTAGGFYCTKTIRPDELFLIRTIKGVNESIRDDFDLEEMFDMLNAKLFNGELKRIPLVWKTMRGSGGHLKSHRVGKYGKETPDYIAISDFYKKNEQQLLDTLAHEMVHLWIVQNDIRDDSYHGHRFMEKMREVNKIGLVNIDLKDDVSDIEVSNDSPLSKPVIVFFQEDHTLKRKLISLISKEAFTKEAKAEIIDAVLSTSKYSKRDFTVKFFESVDPSLRKFSVARKFKRAHTLKYYKDIDAKPSGEVETIEIKDGKIQ